ncbi:nad binding rossmann fold [Diplodia corticola]|uniref:Nad binding rossmann fold n=1 Tax=Diplodia corticola TaxID=236234 RepID=A0A1J9QQF0_9PEZI|nr:nad binding rossmann fold [Diplodia corticola]OJD31158.1 nad binding rossmann fold [Diplodia corticola]
MASKVFNFGVIGYGLSAKIFHIPHLTAIPSFKLYGIVQRTPKAGDDCGADHPEAKSWRSADELFADSAVDVVVLTTPPDTHFPLAKRALELGKHVVVEKAFVPSHAEGEALAALAREHKRSVAVYHNRRWDADFVTLRQLLAEGTLGRIVDFNSHFDRYSPTAAADWKAEARPGNGTLFDLGSHLLDQIVTLFGMPARITAFVGNTRAGAAAARGQHDELGDAFTVHLHYADGMLATARAGVLSVDEEQLRFWVRGDKGSFKKFHLDVQEPQLLAGMLPGQEGFGVEPEGRHGTVTLIEDGRPVRRTHATLAPKTYVEYYRLLEKAYKGEGEVPVTAEEGAAVIRLIELARESSRLGKTLDV